LLQTLEADCQSLRAIAAGFMAYVSCETGMAWTYAKKALSFRRRQEARQRERDVILPGTPAHWRVWNRVALAPQSRVCLSGALNSCPPAEARQYAPRSSTPRAGFFLWGESAAVSFGCETPSPSRE
jgi:hypothetical protein